MVKVLAFACLVACADEVIVIAPVIDGPPDGSTASAFPELDTVELSIALAGEPDALSTATFKRGEPLELRDVPYGENLVIHMLGRVAGVEVATGRTCTFAIRPDEPPPAPHLYFARTVRWGEAETPASRVRLEGTAIMHRDGSALFLGGHLVDNVAVRGVDRFDALNGVFEPLVDVSTRSGGSVAALGDGRIVIAGGIDPSTAKAAATIDVVLVDTRQVEAVDAGPLLAGIAPTLATLSDGRIVAFGGRDVMGTPISQLVEISGEGAITLRVLRSTLAIPRFAHTATRLSDDFGAPVLITGGVDGSGALIAGAELYKPLIEELATGFTRAMVVPRRDHQAVRLNDGSVLIVGGRDATGTPVRTLELFSLESGFLDAGTLPSTAGLTEQSLTTLPDGRILLSGGRDELGNVVNDVFIIRLDPIGGGVDIVTTDPLSRPRARHQATTLCDGTVMLVGGTDEPTPAERYNPPSAGRR
ncbi:MAG: kelch repeat-containing protein [Kofleriaceae bacterium]